MPQRRAAGLPVLKRPGERGAPAVAPEYVECSARGMRCAGGPRWRRKVRLRAGRGFLYCLLRKSLLVALPESLNSAFFY